MNKMNTMDADNGWFRKFIRLHTFRQELTNDGQKYYFDVNLKKCCLFLASSVILALGSILGLIMFFPTFLSTNMIKSYILYVIAISGLSILGALFLVFLVCTIYLIVMIPRLIKLQKFTLALKEEEVSVHKKSLTIPEKLTMRIFVRVSYSVLTTTLIFEPLNLSPFSQISKVEKYLSYHEKRRLAEQLSSNLKIPLTDMFSSFEPGIYENKQNFAEKLKFTELEPSGNFKLTTSKNVHSIQLPYEKTEIFTKLLPILPLYVSSFIFINTSLSIAERLATSLDFLLIAVFFVILISAFFLPLILKTPIRCKIVVSDDSISMIKQNIWGERRIFHSSFNELKDISIFRGRIKSSRIVFRSDKLTEFTGKIPKEAVADATMTINNLLVKRL